MYNTYKIGKQIAKGINLESAAESLGYTGIQIVPLWYRRSNGKYKIYCNEETILLCEWVEKVNSLSLN
jgi:hypothetical protein